MKRSTVRIRIRQQLFGTQSQRTYHIKEYTRVSAIVNVVKDHSSRPKATSNHRRIALFPTISAEADLHRIILASRLNLPIKHVRYWELALFYVLGNLPGRIAVRVR